MGAELKSQLSFISMWRKHRYSGCPSWLLPSLPPHQSFVVQSLNCCNV